MQFVISLSFLLWSLNYSTAPAITQQIKQKKYAGPPTPATTFQGKKSKKTKPAAERKTPRA
jgi:hypothetical protein